MAGSYLLDSLFTMRSFGGTFTTDVHVLLNAVSRSEVQASINNILLLALDDRLDFAVHATLDFVRFRRKG